MKLVLVFMCAFLINATASVYSQNTQFTFSVEGKTIKDVFRLIEKESQFRFLYNDDFTDLNQPVTIDVKDNKVEDILNKMLNKSEITYRIMENNLIVITPVGIVQQLTVTGTVTDEANDPLPGVNITVKGTLTGVVSDINGRYSINIPNKNAVLVFSFVGYTSQEIATGDQTDIKVMLKEAISAIEEVVVVGYGTQKKVNLTGAVTVADPAKLENRPITTTSQALQGLNGLWVNQNTGQPGNDQATIRIRGVGTLNNNDPLILIDGISYPLLDINPNEIESISVLKDAASTAVYGSRAANGVILIKTKAGKRGEGFRVSYNNFFGVEKVVDLPDVEWDPIKFMKYKNIALTNEGKAKEYTDAEIEEYERGIPNDPNGYMYPRTNPYDIALQNGFMQEHNLIVSGGGDKYNMALTLGAMSQDGVLKYDKSKANKYSVGLNTKVDLTDFLSIGGKISAIYRKYNEPQITMDTYWEQAIFRTVPIFPVLIEDGRYGNTWLRSTGLNAWANTLSRLKEGSRDYERTRVLGNVFADLKLPFNITYRINLAANTYDYIQHVFQPYLTNINPKTLAATVISNTTRGYRRYEKELNLSGFQTLEWSETFAGKHNVGALLGNSYERFTWEYFNAQKDGSLDNELTDMDVFLTNPTVAGNSTVSAILSYFGRVNYNFNEKYLLEASFRYDGSSRFAKGHRWGFFPSFSVGWRIDQESFMQNVGWVTSLKPRFSWGKIGNQQIDLWSYINAVSLGQNYSFGTTEAIGAATTTAADPNLSWETTTMSNLGFDIALFKGKINTTIELYNKDTDGILRPVNYASQVGDLTGPTTNIGSMNNKGIEVTLNYRDRKGEFSYEVGGSFAYNKNEVTNLDGQEIISGRYITKEGYPYKCYYIYEVEPGFFQSQEEIDEHAFQNAATKVGFLKYKNQNPAEDKKIDAKDKKIFHGVVPEFTYAFNIGIGYKGFDLTAFFQGVGKVYTYTQHNISYPYYNGAGVTKEWETDSWTPDNRNARLPILTTSTGNTLNFENSNFWLQNASYLRMKNIQLSYTFPASIARKLFMKDLKIFVNGQNLLTFTKMKNWDPEKQLDKDNIFSYPQEKIYSAGLNVTF